MPSSALQATSVKTLDACTRTSAMTHAGRVVYADLRSVLMWWRGVTARHGISTVSNALGADVGRTVVALVSIGEAVRGPTGGGAACGRIPFCVLGSTAWLGCCGVWNCG